MISKVVIPLDGSHHCEKALRVGCDLAAKYGAAVHLVHVTESPGRDQALVLGESTVTVDASLEELNEAGLKIIEVAREYARNQGIKEITTEVSRGNPAYRIIDSARETRAEMIVMGSRGLSDLGGLLVGSVSHKVSNLAPCTCVTVK